MSILERLHEIKKKIQSLRSSGKFGSLNEMQTRKLLIDPLIASLGYDLDDLEHVCVAWRCEKERGEQKEADYALFLPGKDHPWMIVEAKRLGADVEFDRTIKQALMYAFINQVEWCLVTNGNQVAVYWAYAKGWEDRTLFAPFAIEDLDTPDGITSQQAVEWLGLLKREPKAEKKVAEYFKRVHAKEAVFRELKRMIQGQDSALVRVLSRAVAHKLTLREIREALRDISVVCPGIRSDTELESPSQALSPSYDWTKNDTIVCPGWPANFEETFLGEKRWYPVRINPERKPYVKYIAIYVTSPISAVTHYGEVASIEPCRETDWEYKECPNVYTIKLKGEPIEIGPVKIQPIQSHMYTSLEELLKRSGGKKRGER